ncbi:hypothetical protein SAMN02799630_05584 [Paenibacillus sp. UNCCL117]|uniref:hypothetical protein n=1 Tax=unclassified Paenibacillus TaxID=185978 RepID=UPI00087F2E4A|nr:MULTISPECIES: hypothetical protein [unclassified Paenibacillus]SDE51511.1 hypothetical protein SAMN04488602_13146 [Paenibacillus sp. cl123]SFW67132.1 hypothetical protein SAMN02799630_05584 [Paenibacillus sp. UNCCL117]
MSGLIPTIVVLLVIVSILSAIRIVRKLASSSRSRRRRRAPYKDTPLPEMLGLQRMLPLQPAVLRMERALNETFTAKIRERVKAEHPAMSDAEFNWKFLELKRYFLMTAVLRDVPMFSAPVDDIWHEMLMFTREYTRFGEAFVGSTIHHAPHTGEAAEPDPGGRAWFDWVYAQLFVPTPYSARIWGPFFRYPLSRELLEELQISPPSESLARLFNQTAAARYSDIRETTSLLLRLAREQAASARPGAAYKAKRPQAGSPDYMPYLAGALMVYSAAEAADFDGLMEQHLLEEEARQRAAASSSSCSSACGASYWNDDRDDSGGDSSCSGDGGGSSDGGSSSSCSSGSSCSSCGGGGD